MAATMQTVPTFGFAPTGVYRPSPYAMPAGLETGKTIESILARERSPLPTPIEQVMSPIVTPAQPWTAPIVPTPYGPMMAPMTSTPAPWSAPMTPMMTPYGPAMIPIPAPWAAPMTPMTPWMAPISPMAAPWVAPMTPAPWAAPSWIQPTPWTMPMTPVEPMYNIASRPSNPVEQMTLEHPIRIVDAEGRREMRVCCDLSGYKPEEITVTLNKAERAVVIEAAAEAKDGKEHQVARKYSRKVMLPETPACKIDIASCGPISAVQCPDGMLIVELPLPKLTVEEMARYPEATYWTRPNTVTPVPVKCM